MTENERLKALARAIYLRGLKVQGVSGDSFEVMKDEAIATAQAALEILGSVDSSGNVIVPEDGALGTAREALKWFCSADCPRSPDECIADRCGVWLALRALGVSDE